MAPAIELLISATDAGLPLHLLAERLAGTAGRLAALRGGLWLDGRRVADPEITAQPGSRLELRLPPEGRYAEADLAAEHICYEDEWLIVLDKQAGWYSGATPWDGQGNLLAALGRFLTQRDGVSPPLHLAHQLDRDTSGLLLVSKHPAANGPLQRAFAGGAIQKRYLCIAQGEPAEEHFELRTGHGRAAGGRWRLYAADEVGMTLPGGGRVKAAHTSFVVERRLGDATLLSAHPHTGRTHQIRLHLTSAGHPLVGDLRYGGPGNWRGKAITGHLLHAAELRLNHPVSGEMLELRVALPGRFAIE